MVSVVGPALGRGRSAWSMFAGNAFVLVLLLTPVGMGPSASSEEGVLLEVRFPGGVDRVELFPHDPRTPELALSAPDAAQGLFVGHLEERGWPLHLVWTPEVALGVLDHGSGASWVTVDEGVLVPFEPESREMEPVTLAAPLVAPGAPGQGTVPATQSQDGVLQIALDGTAAFHDGLEETWREAQLMVIHLVDGVYQANLGVAFEVVSQHTWTVADPEPFTGTGDCFQVLPSFRDHWESVSPTTGDVREAMHLFAGEPFDGTTIGCAYIGQLETSRAYGVSEVSGKIGNVLLDLHRNVALVSHEIGHNFNGEHSYSVGSSCYGATIMFDTLCANSPVFSGVESLTLCRTGLVSSCSFVTYGNAYRMWYYASDRI